MHSTPTSRWKNRVTENRLFTLDEQNWLSMDKLETIRRFVRVAELGSFTRAADSLGLPKASVSNGVRQLEEHLGTRLLMRSTRRVTLTQDGLDMLERSRAILADIDALDGHYRQQPNAERGVLRVDMTTQFARHVLIPRLPEFLGRYPGISLELSSIDQPVDIIREGFDCVIRSGELADSSLVAQRLTLQRCRNYVSQCYIERKGLPTSIKDLPQHELIGYTTSLGVRDPGFEYVDGEGTTRLIEMPTPVTVNGTVAYLEACKAGLGIAQIPETRVCRNKLKDELIEVLPNHCAAPLPMNVVYASRRLQPRRLLVFIEWLREIVNE